jgi:hypothetical protein
VVSICALHALRFRVCFVMLIYVFMGGYILVFHFRLIIMSKGLHLLIMGTINDLLILNSNLMVKH